MDARTLEALNKSIAHWEEMAKNGWKNEQPEVGQCALCKLFRWQLDPYCTGCPIMEAGHILCDGTPYDDAEDAYNEDDEPAFLDAAYREVKFLKSLLPKPVEHSRNEAETLQP